MGLALSCSGIGGGKAVPYDSVYGNGTSGGSTGGSSGSSGDGSSTGVFVPIGITPFINPDNIDAFIQLFQSGGDEGGSSPIVLDPDDLGLPDGGFVTLTMNWAGGSYTRTVQKNADGTVTFDGLGSLADGTSLNVTLTVENASHEKVWEGSGTGEVNDGLCNVDVKLKRFLPLSELADYIAALPTNTPDTPHKLPPLSGLTAGNLGTLKAALQNNTSQYVDLSATTLPSGITSLAYAFNGCMKLAKAPVIPVGVTDMQGCFADTFLSTPPVIPAGVTNLFYCFAYCRLATPPVIPEGVQDMGQCFLSCSNLTTAPVIPDSVTNMADCFKSSYNLTAAPEIPANVTDLSYCFAGCSTGFAGTYPAIIIKANITDPGKFDGFMQLSYTSGVYVISDAVKTAILSATSTGLSSGQIHVGLP